MLSTLLLITKHRISNAFFKAHFQSTPDRPVTCRRRVLSEDEQLMKCSLSKIVYWFTRVQKRTFLRLLVMQPASTKSTTPSLNISVWIPSSRCDLRLDNTASGILPIPVEVFSIYEKLFQVISSTYRRWSSMTGYPLTLINRRCLKRDNVYSCN